MVRPGFSAIVAIFATIAALSPSYALAQDSSEPLSAEDQEARVHFRLGNAYYESGRFNDAAREFVEAYRLSRRPALLYNVFVAHRDAGSLLPAIQALRAYLRLVPDAEQREQLTARLAAMERVYREQHGEDAPEGEIGATEQEAPQEGTPEEATEQPRETQDTTQSGGSETWMPGWILAGVGGAVVIAGIITGVLALDAQSQLQEICDDDGSCDPGFEGTRDSGALLAGLTDAFLIGGGIVLAAGVVLAFALSTSPSENTSASLMCAPTGCAGSLRVRF